MKVFLVGKARYCGKCVRITTKNTTDQRQINCKFKDMHDSWVWLALGGHNWENFCPFGVTEDAIVPLGLKNAQECDHVSSPFCIDKLRIWPKLLSFCCHFVNKFCWQNQLSFKFLNLWSSCFRSIELIKVQSVSHCVTVRPQSIVLA